MLAKLRSAPCGVSFLLLTTLFLTIYLVAHSTPSAYVSMVDPHAWLIATTSSNCSPVVEQTVVTPPSNLTLPTFTRSTEQINSTVTLVSAFYPLSSSKHSLEDYAEWLQSFFGRIETPVMVFTTAAYANTILKARGNLPIYLSVEYSTPFDTRPIRGLEEEYYGHQHKIDREYYHNGGLYAVWNSKAFLMNRTTELNPFNSDYFLWVDAGCFRDADHPFRKWPDAEKVVKAFEGREAMPLFQVIQPLPTKTYSEWKLSDGPIDVDYMAAAIFGGHRLGVRWLAERYYQIHDQYLKEGKFVGKEQPVYNALITEDRARVLVAPSYTVACGNCWFYLQGQLANHNESMQHCGRDVSVSNIQTVSDLVATQKPDAIE